MPRRIVIIQGHPDPAPERLCRALGAAYARGAVAADHQIVHVDLAHLDFPLLAGNAAFLTGEVPEALRPAAAAIRSADHIVLIFPLWLGTMPALVKGFLEQVMRPGTAFAYRDKGFPVKLLAGKSARLVVTMGMPALLYRLWYRAHGVRGLERNILDFVGVKPVRTSWFGSVEAAGDAVRRSWLDEMTELGRRGG